MRGLLISAAVLFLSAGAARAQVVAPRQVSDVEQTYRSTMTCTALLVSSATAAGGQATQVITSTQTLWGAVTIQNQDSSANVYVSDSIQVASSTASGVLNANTGFELAKGSPGGSGSFYIGPGELLYVVNDGGVGKTVVVICKGH